MEIHCIRHGETISNIEGTFNGWIDEGITRQQAKVLSETIFKHDHFDAIYCSNLQRCKETATCLGIENWVEDERLKERNLGVFEGKSPVECNTFYPSAFAQFQKFDATFAPDGGESRSENFERVFSWVEDVKAMDRVLAITHGGPIDFLYRMATGIDLHGGEQIFASSNAGYSIFSLKDNTWSLISYDLSLS